MKKFHIKYLTYFVINSYSACQNLRKQSLESGILVFCFISKIKLVTKTFHFYWRSGTQYPELWNTLVNNYLVFMKKKPNSPKKELSYL
ncbi:hypothetical protein DQM68_05085 [Leptospira mayottensis]|nr:hypothetical protein DQM68_05085 [Leptospira mayottensis]AZQ03406.1 hypothetical protein LEP1GSC190_16665 [Leptospira mayottensis 200901116]